MGKFKFVPVSVNWDDTYHNTMYFDNVESQLLYFNIPTIFNDAKEIVSFPKGSLFNCNITYQYKDKNNGSLQELLNDNYCILQETNTDKIDYYYFFIKSVNYDSNNQVTMYLELDVIQTYMLSTNFSDCYIERCHQDRFIKNSSGTYSFNNNTDSPLLNSEGVNLPKYLTSAEKLLIKYDTVENQDNNINASELLWAYVYISNDGLEQVDAVQSFAQEYGTEFNNFKNPYTVLVAPIPTYNQIVYARYRTSVTDATEIRSEWNFNKMLEYLKTAFSSSSGVIDLTPYILNVKLSPVPPFKLNEYRDNFFTKDAGYGNYGYECRIIQKQATLSDVGEQLTTLHSPLIPTHFLAFVYRQDTADYNIDIELDSVEFTRDYIINADYRDIEPKALSENCQELKIRDYEGNSIVYDIQKLNNKDIKLKLIEPFTVDRAAGFLSLSDIENSIYKDSALGLLGLIYNNDSSIPYSIDQLATYMASNKNFDKIRSWNVAKQDINSTLGLTNGLIGKNPSHLLSGAQGFLNTTIDQQVVDLTLDNMSASPDTLKNLSGSIFLNSLINNGKAGFYKEIFKGTEIDINKMIDYLHEYGYSYSMIDNVKKHINTRVDFNYIKAELQSITSDIKISNSVRQKFREVFRNGITFWRSDDFNLSLNNVERSVINGE